MQVKLNGINVTNWDIFYGKLSEESTKEKQDTHTSKEECSLSIYQPGFYASFRESVHLETFISDYRHSVQ